MVRELNIYWEQEVKRGGGNQTLFLLSKSQIIEEFLKEIIELRAYAEDQGLEYPNEIIRGVGNE